MNTVTHSSKRLNAKSQDAETQSEVSVRSPAGSVVYMMPGADEDQITQYCAANKLLSISGVPPFAEQGLVSVSIGKNGERPQIIVNLPRLKVEGHDLSSDVLKLAKVIR